MAPPSVPIKSKKQRERNRGRKRRRQLRQQGQTQRLQEAESHETVRLVNQVHHGEADVTNRHIREHSHRAHSVAPSTDVQHFQAGTSDLRISSIGNNTSRLICPTRDALSLTTPVIHSPTDTRQTSGVFRTDTNGTITRQLSRQGAMENITATIPESFGTDEEVSAVTGRRRRDPALSERELTRLRVRAYRARQHLARIPQAPPPQNNSLLSSRVHSDNQSSPQGTPCQIAQNDATTSPVASHQGDDAPEAADDSGRGHSNSPVSPTSSDFGLAVFDTVNGEFRRVDTRSASPDRQSMWCPTSPVNHADQVRVDLPYLDRFVKALRAQETRSGLDFLESQITAYDCVFRRFFSIDCRCSGSHEIQDHTRAHTLQERVRFLQGSLPPLATIFDENFTHEATRYVHQGKEFLSDEPAEPLSFRKTEATLENGPVRIERRWDVDSIWFGPKSLQAIPTQWTGSLEDLSGDKGRGTSRTGFLSI